MFTSFTCQLDLSLFSLYIFISQRRSCDNTLKNYTFHTLKNYTFQAMEIIYEKTKGRIPLRPSLAKQNDLNQVVESSGFSENNCLGLGWVLILADS